MAAAEPARVLDNPVGVRDGDPLEQLGIRRAQLREPGSKDWVRFVGKTLYLNNARAVVTHTIDDSTGSVPAALDIVDRYGIKATIFVVTRQERMSELWPTLRQAINDGHEIGAHSRTHRCTMPENPASCARLYSESEIAGSRDDILANTGQRYVWSWAYPCGCCASLSLIQERVAHAGYIVARNYPNPVQGKHLAPNLQAWDSNPYDAAYTQVAQTQGGIATSGRTDIAVLNAKFDEVYLSQGIYTLVSDPQWLDLGPNGFYERHLAYVGVRPDIWYVPLGPLYGYQTVRDRTEVRSLKRGSRSWGRFVVYNDLDPKIYDMSITLEFTAPPMVRVFVNGKRLQERKHGVIDRWTGQYYRRELNQVYVTIRPNTVLEFR
jgi:peptidoglycan/xylan/chitin deacetylase (PgdA/CDA1 family)